MSIATPPLSKPDGPSLASGLALERHRVGRSFRPDVEGLRAVAILLVVLYHAGVSRFSGGYVGVDVFFVISGFVITGVLLRERDNTGRISILSFYGRRARRIIPAASLVIVVTVVLSYELLGVVGGNQTATDGIWATLFLSNFHFASTGTNYLTEFQSPSPLLNFWSLAVEEQFYVVFPALLMLVALVRVKLSLRVRLVFVLSVIIVASYVLSIVQTAANPTFAYFSPFNRAFELALGALIAAASPWLLRVPTGIAVAMTWIGLELIALTALTYSAQTVYPGAAVGLPVLGAGLVIAGGTRALRHGAESLLRLWPFRQLGKLSYSLYLWHWPILVLAAEHDGLASLPVKKSLLWVLLALLLSILTYLLLENPIRTARPLRRNRLLSVGLGIVLMAVTLGVIVSERQAHAVSYVPQATTTHPFQGTASLAEVERQVAVAAKLRSVPANLDPPLGSSVLGYPFGSPCWARDPQSSVQPCVFGDPHGNHTMVLTGDSHAEMWFYTIDAIAKHYHWQLRWLTKPGCPTVELTVTSGRGANGGTDTLCSKFHTWVANDIKKIDPDLVIVTEENRQPPDVARPYDAKPYSDAEWTAGLDDFFRAVSSDKTKLAVIGNIPQLPQTGPDCVAKHTGDLQACDATFAASATPYHQAEKTAVESYGGRYIDPTPWFCSKVCTPVIGNYEVYFDHFHIMGPYGLYLSGVLAQALDLPPSSDQPTQSTK